MEKTEHEDVAGGGGACDRGGGRLHNAAVPAGDRHLPQVVSCANQTPDPPTSDPDWQPTLRVEVEPVRGTPDESGSIGCLGAASTTTTVTSDDPSEARGLFTGVRVQGRLETRRSREDGRRRPPERGDSPEARDLQEQRSEDAESRPEAGGGKCVRLNGGVASGF